MLYLGDTLLASRGRIMARENITFKDLLDVDSFIRFDSMDKLSHSILKNLKGEIKNQTKKIKTENVRTSPINTSKDSKMHTRLT